MSVPPCRRWGVTGKPVIIPKPRDAVAPPSRRASIRHRQPAKGCVGLPGEPCDELGGGLTARQPDALARPQRKEFRAALFRGGAAQRPRQRVLERERKDRVGAG